MALVPRPLLSELAVAEMVLLQMRHFIHQRGKALLGRPAVSARGKRDLVGDFLAVR
jgi:hypothetical protein